MLSQEFLLNRKECCGEGCHMCPYFPKHKAGNREVDIRLKSHSNYDVDKVK